MNRIDEDWELINLFRNLRYLRHQKGLSLHGAARQAGMDPRRCKRWKRGGCPSAGVSDPCLHCATSTG